MTRPSALRCARPPLSWLLAIAVLAFAGAAHGAPRLEVLRYQKPTPGSDIETGGAWTVVQAPLPIVRQAVQSYAKYVKVMPRLEQSRIVGRKKGATDLYMRAPILNGVAHLWGVIRFSPPQKVGKWEMIVGRYVKGNLNAYHGVWKLYPCAPDKTLLKMEMFADLKIPMPASVVSPELAWIADVAVTSIRDRAECVYRRKQRGKAPVPPSQKPAPPAPPPATPPVEAPTAPAPAPSPTESPAPEPATPPAPTE
ncbi:MAG: hypothetical protein JRI23_08580 [Deltaproteobacteria bacterium]|jgi:ribosome-associated toxin RatA of RatAB toxin-antitoxin module|nr:hypothetical protein [Deltaproteobacteria bacterium]MBW2531669.1 hypothetical protein [Deltaproteobacteria bacterium]